MAVCQNCESHVQDAYRRVFGHPDAPEGKVKCCPHCPDIIRDPDGVIREARSQRRVEQ